MGVRDVVLTPLQQNVMDADADIVGFGGAFGIGMTTAAHVIAYRKHKKSILFSSDWQKAMTGGMELFDRHEATWIGNPRRCWEFNGRGGRLQIGKLSQLYDSSRYRGGEWDGMFFDDIGCMPYEDILHVMAWNRSRDATIKPQTYIMFYPPSLLTGIWVYNMFAPWIEIEHPSPARDGEKRWMICHGGSFIEVPSQAPIEFPKIHNEHGSAKIWTTETTTYYPRSVTFYRGGCDDVQRVDGIDMALNSIRALPNPFATQLLEGDFQIGRDHRARPDLPQITTHEATDRLPDARPPGRIADGDESDETNYQDTSDVDNLIALIQRGLEGEDNE